MDDKIKTLGDIPKIRRNISIWDKRFIKALHFFIYHEAGGRDRRARIRDFSGFHFTADDDEFENKVQVISNVLSMSDLVSICAILDIQTDSDDLISLIFNHLIAGSLLEYNPRSDSNSVCGDDVKKVEVEKRQGEPHIKGSSDKENLNFKSIPEFVKPFRGCSDYPVESWVKDFEDAASTWQLKDWQKLMLARNSLKGFAKSLVEERRIYQWDELKSVLMNEFRSKMSGKALHEALTGRMMKSNESIFEYYQEMKIIADQGTLEDQDLIEYIIHGTPNDPLKDVLYGATSLDHFREKLKDYDSAKGREKIKSSGAGASGHKTEGMDDEKSTSSAVIPEQDNFGFLKNKSPQFTSVIYRQKPPGAPKSKFHCCSHMPNECVYEPEELRFVRENFNGLPKKEVFLKGKRFYAMIDSGSQLNLINTTSYQKIGSPTLKNTMLFLRGFGRARVPPEGFFEEVVQIDGYSFRTRFYVVGDDILKRDVIIGSTLLHEAEFTIRRNEILIRKIEDSEQCNTNSSAKNKESFSSSRICTCADRKTEPSVSRKPVVIAIRDEGSNKGCNFQMVLSDRQKFTSDLQDAIAKDRDEALEYRRKFIKAEEYIANVGRASNPVDNEISYRSEPEKITEFIAKLRNKQVTRLIQVEEGEKENECKLMVVEESENTDELKSHMIVIG